MRAFDGSAPGHSLEGLVAACVRDTSTILLPDELRGPHVWQRTFREIAIIAINAPRHGRAPIDPEPGRVLPSAYGG